MTLTVEAPATTVITVEDEAGFDALPVGALFESVVHGEMFVRTENGYAYHDEGYDAAYTYEDAVDDEDLPATLLNPEILGDFLDETVHGVKVGDRIRLTRDVACYDIFAGQEFDVVELREGSIAIGIRFYDKAFFDYRTGYLWDTEVEKVVPEVDALAEWEKELLGYADAGEVKPGDMVRVLADAPGAATDRGDESSPMKLFYDDFTPGMEAKVLATNLHYSSDYPNLTQVEFGDGKTRYVRPVQIQKVAEADPGVGEALRVGDRVRVVNTPYFKNFPVGTVGTIMRLFAPDVLSVRADTTPTGAWPTDGSNPGWTFHASDVEKVSEPVFEEFDAKLVAEGWADYGKTVRVVALGDFDYDYQIRTPRGGIVQVYAHEIVAYDGIPEVDNEVVGDVVVMDREGLNALPDWSVVTDEGYVWTKVLGTWKRWNVATGRPVEDGEEDLFEDVCTWPHFVKHLPN